MISVPLDVLVLGVRLTLRKECVPSVVSRANGKDATGRCGMMRSPPGSYAWCAATWRRRGARRGEEREASALTRKDIIRERRTVGLPKTDTRGGRHAHIRRGTWHDVLMSASPHVTPHSQHACDLALHPYSLALHSLQRCGLASQLALVGCARGHGRLRVVACSDR